LEITKNLQLRNPTFLRFREDKRIEDCVLWKIYLIHKSI
jgi:hypothetical protein